MVEAERPALLELVGGAGRPHDDATECVGELHRGGADAGPRGVHEHGLTRRDRGLGDHRVVRGDEHLGHAAGGDEVERLGDARALARRHR